MAASALAEAARLEPLPDLVPRLKELLQAAKRGETEASSLASPLAQLLDRCAAEIRAGESDGHVTASPLPCCVLAARVLRATCTVWEGQATAFEATAFALLGVADAVLVVMPPGSGVVQVPGKGEARAPTRAWVCADQLCQVLKVVLAALGAVLAQAGGEAGELLTAVCSRLVDGERAHELLRACASAEGVGAAGALAHALATCSARSDGAVRALLAPAGDASPCSPPVLARIVRCLVRPPADASTVGVLAELTGDSAALVSSLRRAAGLHRVHAALGGPPGADAPPVETHEQLLLLEWLHRDADRPQMEPAAEPAAEPAVAAGVGGTRRDDELAFLCERAVCAMRACEGSAEPSHTSLQAAVLSIKLLARRLGPDQSSAEVVDLHAELPTEQRGELMRLLRGCATPTAPAEEAPAALGELPGVREDVQTLLRALERRGE